MKIKLIIFILTILIILSGCKSEKEKNKEKYDSAINQVITLESKRISDIKALKREEVGIIVYGKGKYIELIYTIKPDNQIESIYKIDQQKKYKYITVNQHIIPDYFSTLFPHIIYTNLE